tara:strand:- start:590 stop:2074 length:1485 start_codon:yes stop_codon:yes gene_type:complete
MTELKSLVGFGAGGGGGGMDTWEITGTQTWKISDFGSGQGESNVEAQNSNSYACLSLRYPAAQNTSWSSDPTQRPYKDNGYMVYYAMEAGGGWTRGYVYCWDLDLTNGTFSAMKAHNSGSDCAWSNSNYNGISTTLGHSYPGAGTFWAGGNNAWPGQSSHQFGYWYAEADSTGYKSGGSSHTGMHHQHSGYKHMRPCSNEKWFSGHPSYHSNSSQYFTRITSEQGSVSKNDHHTSSYYWGGNNNTSRQIDTPYCPNGSTWLEHSGYRNSSYYYYLASYDADQNHGNYHWYSSGNPQHNSNHVSMRTRIMSNGDAYVKYNSNSVWKYAGKEENINKDGPDGTDTNYTGWQNPTSTLSDTLNYPFAVDLGKNDVTRAIPLGDNKYMVRLGSWTNNYWSESNPIVIVEMVEDTVNSMKVDSYWRIIKSWDAPATWDPEKVAYRNRSDAEMHLPIYEGFTSDWPKYIVDIVALGSSYKATCRKVPAYADWSDRSIDLK